MFTFRIIWFAFFLIGVGMTSANAQSVDGLSWMAGCWELNVPQRQMTISEHWMKPAGGSMIGMSRTVRAGKTTGFEFIRIISADTGLAYIAKPSSNKEETAFPLLRSSESEVVFENLTHDFPQRIIYRRKSPDELAARVEATKDGKVNGMDIPMKRVACN